MQEIKYQPLRNTEDDLNTSVPLKENDNKYFVQEFKRNGLMKFLLITFIIIKLIYIINNYDNIINWFQGHINHNNNNTVITMVINNQTDIYDNITNLYNNETTTTTTILDIFYLPNQYKHTNDNYSFVTITTPANNSNNSIIDINNKHDMFNNIIKTTVPLTSTTTTKTTTAIASSNYDNSITAEAAITTTTTPIITKTTTTNDLKNDFSKETFTIINLNNNLTTEKYFNTKLDTSTLWPTTMSTATTTTTTSSTTTTTTTTTKSPMTASPIKTPAIKLNSPENDHKYFINTSHCHIPFVDPFNSEVRKIFKPHHSSGCTKDQPIITVSFNETNARYNLNINYKIAENLRRSTKRGRNETKAIEEDLVCCYQEIIRSGSGTKVDSSFKLLPCTNFHQHFVVPLHINGIIVNCKLVSQKSTLQQDAFTFIQVNKTLIEQELEDAKNKRRKPSVLMIGIDSLSRINFRRNMPEMLKYLIDNKWYELKGYNKVGDNTLPNLMPLLSGYTKTTVYEKCQPIKVGGFDKCNFIWTTYKNNGYHTAYAEDSSVITTFNYKLKGFEKPPTDYYFRPLELAIEKSLKKTTKAGLYYCVGRRQLGEYVYDNAMDFVTRYRNLSSFGFFWTNSFSHNSYDVSATMDKRMVEYFREWEKRGIIENSVVIFFSDHGVRWGPLLKLSEGFLEQRLPMFFISLPKWFKEEYPELVRNLEINQYRLASPFDIHMTLQHLLKLGDPNYKMQQALDCPKCQSIFEVLPENRTCDEAGIPETWCTCLPYENVATKSELVNSLAQMIVQEMNRYYENKNLTEKCEILQLSEILKAKKRYKDEMYSPLNTTTYAIDFSTLPRTEPKTLFSATVDYDKQTKRINLNVEEITRQSLYENTAKCTDDKQAKKYCICKNSTAIITNKTTTTTTTKKKS